MSQKRVTILAAVLTLAPGGVWAGGEFDDALPLSQEYIKVHGAKPTWSPMPWYPGKTTPSFADALAALRTAIWRRQIFVRSAPRSLPRKFAATLIGTLAQAT